MPRFILFSTKIRFLNKNYVPGPKFAVHKKLPQKDLILKPNCVLSTTIFISDHNTQKVYCIYTQTFDFHKTYTI